MSYHNGGNGLFTKKMGAITHRGASIIENSQSEAISFKMYQHVPYDWVPALDNVLVVGVLDGMAGGLALHHPQDEHFYLRNVTFKNFAGGAMGGCNDCLSAEHMKQGAFTTRVESVKFINTQLRIKYLDTKKEIYLDVDGSLTGFKDAMVTRAFGHMKHYDVCVKLPDDVYDDSVRCGGEGSQDPSVRIRRMEITNIDPGILYWNDIYVQSPGNTRSLHECSNIPRWCTLSPPRLSLLCQAPPASGASSSCP